MAEEKNIVKEFAQNKKSFDELAAQLHEENVKAVHYVFQKGGRLNMYFKNPIGDDKERYNTQDKREYKKMVDYAINFAKAGFRIKMKGALPPIVARGRRRPWKHKGG